MRNNLWLALVALVFLISPIDAHAHGKFHMKELPKARNGTVCVGEDQPHYRLVYARPSDTSSDYIRRSRELIAAMNSAGKHLEKRYQQFAPQEHVRIPIICGAVDNVVLPTISKKTNFETIKSDLRNAGYAQLGDQKMQRVMLLFDYGGKKQILHSGESESFQPLNVQIASLSGLISVHYIYRKGQQVSAATVLHELLHSMGAVMPGAEGSDGQYHCLDGPDILCSYATVNRRICTEWIIDCKADTYFRPNPPRSHSLTNGWNLAGKENLWLRVTKPGSSASTPTIPEVEVVQVISTRSALLRVNTKEMDYLVYNGYLRAQGNKVAEDLVLLHRTDFWNNSMQITLRSQNEQGDISAPSTPVQVTFPVDTVAPQSLVPLFKAKALRWSEQDDDISHYFVQERICKKKRCNWKKIGMYSGGASNYTMSAKGKYYRIRAVDFVGNSSAWTTVKA